VRERKGKASLVRRPNEGIFFEWKKVEREKGRVSARPPASLIKKGKHFTVLQALQLHARSLSLCDGLFSLSLLLAEHHLSAALN
jgi:hypothetical protein